MWSLIARQAGRQAGNEREGGRGMGGEEEEKASGGLVEVMLEYNFPASGETLVEGGGGG